MTDYNLTLSVNHEGIPPLLDVVQGDSGRNILVTVADMDISDCTARVYVVKPSGLDVYNDANIIDSTITVALTAQMLSEVGNAKMQISIYDTTAKRVSTFNIYLNVEPSLQDNGLINSSTEYSALDVLISNATTAIGYTVAATEAANNGAQAANTAARDANNAAGTANTAAQAANASAQNADNATSAANTAAQSANTAAGNAQSATTAANNAAQEANAATINASEAARIANEAVDELVNTGIPMEVGEWTPVVNNSNVLSARAGFSKYSRVGNIAMVSAILDIAPASSNTNAGEINITGLPFVDNKITPTPFTCWVSNNLLLDANYTNLNGMLSSKKCSLYVQSKSDYHAVALSDNLLQNRAKAEIRFEFAYQITINAQTDEGDGN